MVDARVSRVVRGLWDEYNVRVSPGTAFQISRLVDIDFLSPDDPLVREKPSPGD